MTKGEIRLMPQRAGRKPIDTPDRRATMEKYAVLQEELLWEHRQEFVRKYVRAPQSFGTPEAWFIRAEWDKEGEYIGPARDSRGRYVDVVTAEPSVTPDRNAETVTPPAKRDAGVTRDAKRKPKRNAAAERQKRYRAKRKQQESKP